MIIDVNELSNNGHLGRFEVIVFLEDEFHTVSVQITLGDAGGAEIRGYQPAAEYVGGAVGELQDMIDAIKHERDIRTAYLRREKIAAEKDDKEEGKWTIN